MMRMHKLLALVVLHTDKCDMSEPPVSNFKSSQLMVDSGVIYSEFWMLPGSTGDKGKEDLIPEAETL